MILPRPPLLVITDRRQARAPLEDMAAAVFAAGGRWLLLRERDLDVTARLALYERLVACARPFGARVMVSSDVPAVHATGASGIHLRGRGDVAAARAALGDAVLIGYSAHGIGEAEAAAKAGADYVTLSPVFESASKPGYGPAIGPAGLRAATARLSVPVIALGGVTVENAAACLEAGAAGIAVMGQVMRAADPGAVMAGLLASFTVSAKAVDRAP